jgi:hypothetical protein
MFVYRFVAAIIGAAVLGGGVSAEVHMALSGNGPSGGFVPVGVLAGIGLGVLATAFIRLGNH